ncbi:hypothetical protein [Egicoccus sp. AB-alg2]|uniref:hypothetical protein n=1 Tax=Egicoccus sp. AB-alg2 TaxID=3242693 RepID=UPI00359D4D98
MPASRPGRATAGLVGVLLAVGATGAVLDARNTTAEAQRAELAAARGELNRDLAALRATLSSPAHDAQQTAAALQVVAAEAVTGSERDADRVAEDAQRLTDDLARQADRLEDAADHPLPSRPAALPVESADPLFARLQPLDDQTLTVAEHLRASANEVLALTTAATALQEAAATYAAATDDLPEGDDPDVHARAWRQERERLAAYREAVEEAADVEGLHQLAAAHGHLLDALEELAADALAALDDDDVDAYNDRVADGIGDDALETWREELRSGAEQALEAAPLRHLERSRALTLGLIKELDNVRRSSNGTLALG